MRKIGALFLLVLFASTSQAAIVQNQQYLLQDHPEVFFADTSDYGLRLDSLQPKGKGPTFSTQLGGARSILEWSGDVATITGTVYNNVTKALWTVSQKFTGVTAIAGGFSAAASRLEITDPVDNFVYIFGGRTMGGSAFTADASSYGCGSNTDCGPLVGRGWSTPDGIASFYANKGKYSHWDTVSNPANDWLVQLTPVPVPAALPLLASGLLGFSFISRKRKTS